MEREEKLRRMMLELGRVLSEVISDSSEATRSLRRIRSEGYSLYLLLGSPGETCAKTPLRLPGETAPRQLPAAPETPEPAFQIDGRDLAFLRSVGIDPTRQLRRRRGD